MRELILDCNLGLPSYEKFLDGIGIPYTKLAAKMFKALWFQYLKDKGAISGVYWSERFSNPSVFNTVLISLSKAGWIKSHSIPARNWSEIQLNEDKLLQYVSEDELTSVRAHNKFKKYILENTPSIKSTATRVNGCTKDTGLVREGFMAAGNSAFSYDTEYLEMYAPVIQQNLTKSMDKIAEIYPEMRHDRATYDTISIEIMDYHIHHNGTYTRGNNYNDSRGRAISSSLGKVFNPIGFKDARALIIME